MTITPRKPKDYEVSPETFDWYNDNPPEVVKRVRAKAKPPEVHDPARLDRYLESFSVAGVLPPDYKPHKSTVKAMRVVVNDQQAEYSGAIYSRAAKILARELRSTYKMAYNYVISHNFITETAAIAFGYNGGLEKLAEVLEGVGANCEIHEFTADQHGDIVYDELHHLGWLRQPLTPPWDK